MNERISHLEKVDAIQLYRFSFVVFYFHLQKKGESNKTYQMCAKAQNIFILVTSALPQSQRIPFSLRIDGIGYKKYRTVSLLLYTVFCLFCLLKYFDETGAPLLFSCSLSFSRTSAELQISARNLYKTNFPSEHSTSPSTYHCRHASCATTRPSDRYTMSH